MRMTYIPAWSFDRAAKCKSSACGLQGGMEWCVIPSVTPSSSVSKSGLLHQSISAKCWHPEWPAYHDPGCAATVTQLDEAGTAYGRLLLVASLCD